MAWTHFPVTATSSTHLYDRLIELWKACRERSWAVGVEFWPQTNVVWDKGVVGSITTSGDAHTLTDGSKSWTLPSVFCTGTRWHNFQCDNAPWLPQFYDVVIDYDRANDPRACVRAQITASTLTTLTLTSLERYVTAGLIPSVSALAGKPYAILKRNGLWWADANPALGRWPDWPNDQELDKGSVLSSTTTTLTIDTAATPTTPGKRWPVNAWAGKDLLVMAGGKLRRATVTSNTEDTLTFPAMPAVPSGDYVIVAPGGKALPGRGPSYPFAWYTGTPKNYWGHHPDDVLRATPQAAATVTYSSGDGEVCEDITRNVFDEDHWSAVDEQCSEADKSYSPGLFKSLRQLQVWLESVCGNFVEKKSYQGKKAIPTFTLATWWHAAGINSGTSTLAGGPNTYTFSVPASYNGHGIHYAVFKDDAPIATGAATAAGGSVAVPGDEADRAGLSVIWSAGWSRYHPKEFTYMYERAAFIPDIGLDELGLSPELVDPPVVVDFAADGSFGVGQWVKRGPSTGYRTYEGFGLMGEAGAFAEGDAARYVGDNYHDPGTGVQDAVETTLMRPGGMRLDLPYWDRFFEGQHPKPPYGQTQPAIRADRVGTATAGTNQSLTDASKNWWSPHWYSGGVLRTESGVATGGSGTTLEIEAVKRDTANEAHCFWLPERFVGFAGPYVEFVLEVDKVVEGQTVTIKRPITAVSGRIVTFPALAGFSVEAGDAYRIREPKYNLNRYKGKSLVLIDPATGAQHEVTITHSDDKTLFFAPQAFTVGAGWGYRIVEHETGGVWLRQGGQWVKPTGDDPRGAPWRANATENLPHYEKKYGRVTKNDYVAYPLFDELYRAINVLRWTRRGLAWASRSDPGVAELNSAAGLGMDNQVPTPASWAMVEGFFYTDLGTAGEIEFVARPNQWASRDALNNFDSLLVKIAGYALYGYGVVDVPTFMACAVDYFAFSRKQPATAPATSSYSNQGQPLVEDRWSMFDSDGAATTPQRRSDRLGAIDVPDPGPRLYPPEFDPVGLSNWHGYEVTGEQAIARWDVPGGMVYVD